MKSDEGEKEGDADTDTDDDDDVTSPLLPLAAVDVVVVEDVVELVVVISSTHIANASQAWVMTATTAARCVDRSINAWWNGSADCSA